MKHLFLILFMMTGFLSLGQVSEDFSDGNINSNPVWSGDTEKFTVTSGELNSASNIASDEFYISTPSTSVEEWEMTVDMKFSTSSANYTDVYLMSDVQDLNTPNNGYFVRIGNTDDEVSLYKISAGSATEIIDGTDDKTHNTQITFKVTVDKSDNWSLFADYGSGYVLEGTAKDNTHTLSSYFGIKIKQSTASFHTKHFYDDIYVGQLRVDKSAPAVTALNILSSTQLELVFDEQVVNATPTRFTLDATYGNPNSINVDGNTIELNYTMALVNSGFNLTLTDLQDVSGNGLDTTIAFTYFEYLTPETGDIILNEIYADPTPSFGLPDAEFIEIYNTSADTLNLINCTLTDGSKVATFDKKLLPPNEYAIVCDVPNESLFTSYGIVFGVTDFPTLNNSGDLVSLSNSSTDVLDEVTYTDNFYKDDIKKAGGYSLERIDFKSSCEAENNWTASNASIGGTPGDENSVFGSNPDTEAPQLLSAALEDNKTLRLVYDEAVNETIALNTANYTEIETSTQPISVAVENSKEVVIGFASDFEENTTYQLEIGNVEDCLGNSRTGVQVSFAIASPVEIGDIVINEILFNPKPNGVDFVELYNNSQKFIDLSELQIGNVEAGIVSNVKQITSSPRILLPHNYVVLTTDSSSTKNDYPNTVSSTLLEVSSLPSMNNDEGTVILVSNGKTLDSVPYNEDQHFELLSSVDGVSLERLSFDGSSTNPSNWFSAASSVGFATPGFSNSQRLSTNQFTGKFGFVSKTISPDGDGYEDLLSIYYLNVIPGTVVNAYVYDLSGRLIAHPINNISLGFEDFLTWDCVNNNGEKVPVGNYILLIKSFDLNGKTTKTKLAFSIVSAF